MSMPRFLVAAALVTCCAAVVAVPQARAETFSASLSAAKPSFGWSGRGAGGPGFECSNDADFRCDTVLFAIDVKGDLNIAIDVEGYQITNPTGAMPYPNLDLYLFMAGGDGTRTGEAIAEAATPVDDEKLSVPGLPAGRYLLEVRSALSIGEDYTGKARLSNFVLPAPVAVAPAGPATAPQPAAPAKAKPRKRSRAACRARARKLKSRRARAKALKRCAKLKA